MNKKKALLAVGCILTTALTCGTMAACGKGKKEAKEYTLDMQGVYAYAQEQGYTGTYEELIAAVKGEKGDKGDKGDTGAQGQQGIQGTGIASIEKTATEGLVDTYTITYTDGTTTTFAINNGEAGVGIASFDKAPVEGNELATEYTITYTDGTTESFIVTDGAKGDRGVGIKSITEKERAEDDSYVIYTITYTNNDTFDFTVENGSIGKDGKDGVSIQSVTPRVGADADGNPCTILTIALSNETSYEISIPNGTKGDKGDKGDNGVGVQTATIATNGDLVFTLTEGEPIVAGNILDLMNSQEEMHTVKFGFYFGDDEVYDEDAYATVTVRDGGKVVDPLFGENKAAIQDMIETDADGYEADGWYYLYNDELVKWSFFGYTVTEDMSLFYVEDVAKPVSYNLTYAGLEGATVYGNLPTTYAKGSTLPSIAAYKLTTETEEVAGEDGTTSQVEKKYVSVFAGWTDAEGKDVNYLSIGDATLTAKWRTVEYGHSDVANLTATAAYNGTETNVIISGDEVTTYKGSFYNNATVKSIYVIAPNLASITNSNVFKQMKACENVVIVSNELTAGKSQMFQDSQLLKNVAIECPKMTKLESYTFRRCYALETVKLPATCTVWGSSVFDGVKTFDVVENFGWEYLNTLTAIGSSSFRENETFTEIRIDGQHFASLEKYDGMFQNNPNVESIYFETFATSVSGSFNSVNSEKIQSVYVNAPLATSFTVSLNNTKTNNIYVYAPMATSIGSSDLSGTTVETIIVTNNVTALPQAGAAVYVVGNLTETGALASSSNAKKVVIDVPTITAITNNAFNNAKQLTTVQIASGNLKQIGTSAFGNCTELRAIILPEAAEGTQYYTSYSSWNDTYNYTGIENIFSNTKKLEYLSNFAAFEEMFKNISAYYNTFAYDAPVFAVDSTGYAYCGNTLYKATVGGDVVIPANVTTIANKAMNGTEITSLAFAEGSQITKIGESVFSECLLLTKVDMTNATALESMGASVFADCVLLKDVTLSTSEKFTTIPQYAFSGNKYVHGIESITIPANITTMNDSVFTSSNLKEITFAEGMKFAAEEESLGSYVFQKTALVDATAVLNALATAGVTMLPWGTFMDCASLVSATIPASFVELDDRVFSDCANFTTLTFAEGSQMVTLADNIVTGSALTSFHLPKLATSLPRFAGMTTLTSVTFEEGSVVTEIGSLDSTQITSIDIPASVTTMGTFKNCTKLTSIEIPAGVTSIASDAFNGCTALTTVTFAEGSKLTRINGRAFQDSGITAIDIPETVNNIGNDAFKNCKNLTAIEIPTAVSTLGGTFNGCSSLAYVSLSAGMVYNSNAFTGTALTTIKLVKAPKHAAISRSATSATSAFTATTSKHTPWYIASTTHKVNIIIGEGITSIVNYTFNGCLAENLTFFIEGATAPTAGTYNVPYTNATQYVGLNTTWEYDSLGMPVVKTAAPEEEVVA
ncbi:MAG: leucine-rich repeat protein [Clostridia bacterium]|nr:leucine-rich repeat protein [Clostridia bacterium]